VTKEKLADLGEFMTLYLTCYLGLAVLLVLVVREDVVDMVIREHLGLSQITLCAISLAITTTVDLIKTKGEDQ
jgi:hypothetical protein